MPEQTPVLQVLNRNTSVISSTVVVLFSLEHLLVPSQIQGLLSSADLPREDPVDYRKLLQPFLFCLNCTSLIIITVRQIYTLTQKNKIAESAR